MASAKTAGASVNDSPTAPAARPAAVAWQLAAALALALLVAGVFVPHFGAGVVSDAFIHLDRASRASPGTLLALLVPTAGRFYRPVTEAVFWAEYQLFGHRAAGYRWVALGCHVLAAALVFGLCRRTTGSAAGAWLAAATFLFTIHAHEPVFDVADLHNALSGVALPAVVLAYLCGARRLALVLAALTFGIDENGLLSLPLLALVEIVGPAAHPRAESVRSATAPTRAGGWRGALRRLAPFAILTGAYLWLRIGVGGGFNYESEPCRQARCLAVAILEYVNRLFVRPDAALELIWHRRPLLALVTLAAVAVLVTLVRPWAWRDRRAALLGVGWMAGAAGFSILALYPYVADRFVYLADMGLALVLGAATAEVRRLWPVAPTAARLGMAAAAVVVAAWLALGPVMLASRGRLWAAAGAQAQAIVDATVRLVPAPPPGARIVFSGRLDSYEARIPPGNTGPYLFRLGISQAVRLRYGRPDLLVTRIRQGDRPATPTDGIRLVFESGELRRVGE
jgi:hypothetical protein